MAYAVSARKDSKNKEMAVKRRKKDAFDLNILLLLRFIQNIFLLPRKSVRNNQFNHSKNPNITGERQLDLIERKRDLMTIGALKLLPAQRH